MQGEFQRTFLMMRPLDPDETGTTGFCRVERSQGRGRLAFNIQGFSRDVGELHAVLAKLNGSAWEIVDCGLIRPDARGNGSVVRDIDGVSIASGPSNKAVGVVMIAKGKAKLVLTGFFGRGKPIDREGIERAAARVFGEPAPGRAKAGAVRQTIPEKASDQAVTDKPAIPEAVEEKEASTILAEEASSGASDASESKDAEETPVTPALPDNVWSAPPLEPGEFSALGLPEELEGVIFPESVYSLRELFERFDVVSPVTGNESEIFIRIPMRDGVSGVDHYLLGVRVEVGTVVAVGYAVPGTMQEQPSGLSDYAFLETPIGGYWMRWEAVV